jgi:hypothetical protein
LHEGIYDTNEFISRPEIEAEAWQLIQNRNRAAQTETLDSEWSNNSRTALMEALMASGHLSNIEIRGTREEIRRTVRSRLLNGWDDGLPGHEKQRRFQEICEVLTTERVEDLIETGALPEDTEVGFISDFTGGNYSKDQTAELGYREANKKGMVRSSGLTVNADGTFSRVIEQISRSNGLAETTFAFLENSGLELAYDKPPDIVAMEHPFIYSRRDYPEGVVDIQRILDGYAGANIRYGDSAESKLNHPEYTNLREESARREAEINVYIEDLAALEKRLDLLEKQKKITYQERTNQFKHEIKRILDAICTVRPDYAKDCFGEKTVVHYTRASEAALRGDWNRMHHEQARASAVAENAIICGMAISSDKAKEFGVELSSPETLVEKLKNSWHGGLIKKGTCVNCKEGPKPVGVKSWCQGCISGHCGTKK